MILVSNICFFFFRKLSIFFILNNLTTNLNSNSGSAPDVINNVESAGDSRHKFTALTHRITRKTNPPQSLVMGLGPCWGSLLNRKSGENGPVKRHRKRSAVRQRRRIYRTADRCTRFSVESLGSFGEH